jgi:curved DNA-binding protein CbpA
VTVPGDPYRVLGLTAGASANEIRSAYRRLAKQFHPDTAGERALPRFLAIQAAYEHLVDPEGRLRDRSGTGRPSAAWAADPDRARATRNAYRARRQGWGRTAGAAAGDADADGAHDRGPAAGSRERQAGQGTAGSGTTGRGGRPGSSGRRPTRKATPGSTSYDEAAEIPRDPAWQGAGWYGPASGTYWTINPREYADPRKHGPIYQARARRAAEVESDDAGTDAPGTDAGWRWAAGGERRVGDDPTGTNASTTGTGPERWTTEGWAYQPEPDSPPDPRPRGSMGRSTASPSGGASEALPDLETLLGRLGPVSLRAFARDGGLRARAVLALVAWPPLAFGVASLIGEFTGCASYLAGCTGMASWASIGVQPVLLLLLALVPTIAAIGAFASLTTLGVIVPLATILGLMTVADPGQGRGFLTLAAALAYVVALAWAVRANLRQAPA